MCQLMDRLFFQGINRNGDHARRPGGKSDLPAIWGPIWMGIKTTGQPALVAAVGIHNVDAGDRIAFRDVGNNTTPTSSERRQCSGGR